ncbi:MAG: sulfatase-like hydrolase/transferase, partial [Deltaproteobacteria bacterium]|nr:sulfatase-like hydrolase/transferase [Deltaproteobacteria bacterium]
RGSSPLFLWVHFQDPHGPYVPPDDLADRYLEAERAAPDGQVLLSLSNNVRGIGGIPTYQVVAGRTQAAEYRAAYDGEVRYADAEIGLLLEGLAERGLTGGAVVIFAADHGEGMGEGNYWFAHGEYLSDALLHVPLLIAGPGVAPGERLDLVSLVDLLPTITGLLGVAPPPELAGRNLFSGGLDEGKESEERAVYFMSLPKESTSPRFGLARGGYKYIVTAGEGGLREELFALGQDGENLLVEEQEEARSMAAALASLRRQFPEAGSVKKRSLSATEREKLRSLGYVSE